MCSVIICLAGNSKLTGEDDEDDDAAVKSIAIFGYKQ